jgi:hypothetical protein
VASLQFDDVSVSFLLYHGESRSLKKTVFAFFFLLRRGISHTPPHLIAEAVGSGLVVFCESEADIKQPFKIGSRPF